MYLVACEELTIQTNGLRHWILEKWSKLFSRNLLLHENGSWVHSQTDGSITIFPIFVADSEWW